MNTRSIRKRWRTATAGRKPQLKEITAACSNLHALMADLRGPVGCPWDREQSLASLRQYILEEAEEVCAAIDHVHAIEEGLRQAAGYSLSNSAAPGKDDRARSPKKGSAILHHPHRDDFVPEASASGAPLPPLDPEEAIGLEQAYARLHDEIGDLMLQGFFLGDILYAMSRGGVERSLGMIVAKLIRRHPHVYGETTITDSAGVLENWENIKLAERAAEPELDR